MKKSFLFIGTILAFVLLLSGCQYTQRPAAPAVTPAPEITAPATPDTGTNNQPVGMANPASTNCINQGGRLEMRNAKKGQYGVCLFDDNRQCEEWALMRGQCPVGGVKVTGYENDAEVFCAITGGTVEGMGTETPMCKRVDGTYCNAQANLDGDCPDPNDPNPDAGNVETP
jgi:hypothetical protein